MAVNGNNSKLGLVVGNMIGNTAGYDAVSKLYGRKVSVRDAQFDTVGVLEKNLGVVQCALIYVKDGVVHRKFLDPDNLHIDEVNKKYAFLSAEREDEDDGKYAFLSVNRETRVDSFRGLAGLVQKARLFARRLPVDNSVYVRTSESYRE
ncbi:hypothetical protein HZA96_04985 [Candidatus Woesearchaeota archaeon]|nr:hypothetical protein [Candidatus Woesearchaeota archaeon]